MNDKNTNILNEQHCDCLSVGHDCLSGDCKCSNTYSSGFCLSEIDFYPPYDNRFLKSYVEDIYDGDNFADYCEYIFEIYEEEGYYD